MEIFNRIPPVFINGDAEAYYRAVAMLQSNQLRGLVQRSLDSYVGFFQARQAVQVRVLAGLQRGWGTK